MKIGSIGIEFLDQSLGVPYRGLPILISADLSTANDVQRLASLVALNILKNGGGCIFVYENLPFSLATKDVLYFRSPEKRRVLQEAMDEGRLQYLNIVLEENISYSALTQSEYVKPVVNDLNRILYEILNARNKIKSFSDIPVLILQSNISSLIVDFEPRAVLNMIRKLILDVKMHGDLFLGILNREMQELSVANSFTHLADYILEFGVDFIEGKKQPYVSVTRTPLPRDNKKRLYKKFTYEIFEDNFYTLPTIPTSFEELKASISYLERGEVIAYDTNYIIAEMPTFIILLKEIEKKLGENEYAKIVKNVGKLIGSHIVRALSSRFKLTDKELFKAAVNHLSITGWGKFNISKEDIKSGHVIVEGSSNFATNYGKSNYPVCIIEGCILRGILEEISSLNWACDEKECIAKGNIRCKFELKLAENNP
ncbi:MAG: V4R domain-containing protein [Candidatus Freyarchaeota archaeon]